jgi:geranylgeranyl pyrophosphate synthase
MIHAYSLIHDDLPCMDDDDFRRGKPTVHKQFGEAMAVLTGDYLLTRSFEVIASDQELSSETKISLIQLLTASSGGFGMIGGQVVDIKSEGLSLSLSTLNKIHQLKTGKMITASIVAGALIAGALQHELECLRTFGEKIGLAFQIIDDVIDVSHSEQKHGKENSSDVENNKTTYVTLLGVEAATAAAHDLLNSGIEALDGIRGDTGQLIAIAKTLIDRQT